MNLRKKKKKKAPSAKLQAPSATIWPDSYDKRKNERYN